MRRHKLVFPCKPSTGSKLRFLLWLSLLTNNNNNLELASTLEKSKVYLKYSYTVKYLWLVWQHSTVSKKKNNPLVMFDLFKWHLPHCCHWRTFLLKVYVFQHFLTIFLSGKLFHLTKQNKLCWSYLVRCFCRSKWLHRWPIPPLLCSFLLFPFVLPTSPPIWGHFVRSDQTN